MPEQITEIAEATDVTDVTDVTGVSQAVEEKNKKDKKEKKEKKKPLHRFGEFELLKAVAILGLPAVHLMEEAMEADLIAPGIERLQLLIVSLCILGPSVFMMCMGFSVGGTRTSPKSIRKLGVQFLVIGAILNIVRWFIPGMLLSIAEQGLRTEELLLCLQSDIYYFVGLFYIFYSFMLAFKMSELKLLMTSVIMLTLNTILTPLTSAYVTNDIAKSLLGNFVYVDETSCFPLLSWAIFPTIGIILGNTLRKADEEKRESIMKRLFCSSFVLTFAFVVFLLSYKIDLLKVLVSPANKYITDFPNVVLLVCLALCLISLIYYLCKAIGASRFMAFMLKISAAIVPFYLLQWVLTSAIIYTMQIVGLPDGCFGIGWYLLSVAAVTAICILISQKYGLKITRALLRLTSFGRNRKRKAAVKK